MPSLNSSNGGGSTSGSPSAPATSVTIVGITFPGAKLTLLKDGQRVTTLIANADGTFTIVVNGLQFGSYQFAVYAEDRDGIVSASYVVNVPVYATQNYLYSDVIIPPTISASATNVQIGNIVSIFGYTAPNATVLVEVPNREVIGSVVSDASGFHRYEVRTSFAPGTYQFRTRAQIGATQSLFSRPIGITYYTGTTPPSTIPPQYAVCVDYNKDGRVNLIDFSILLFWFGKPNAPATVNCNSDGLIDIKDFSILMYFWTG